MGWSIHFKSDKQITDELVRQCVDELPTYMKGHGSEQAWGWTCAVDVNKPSWIKRDDWYISGAFYSWSLGRPFAVVMKDLLEKRGLKITLGEQS